MGLLRDLDAFYLEHRRCGELDTGVEDGRVWMTCDGCGAVLSRLLLRAGRFPVRSRGPRQHRAPEPNARAAYEASADDGILGPAPPGTQPVATVVSCRGVAYVW